MKAVVFEKYGGVGVLQLKEVADPVPGPDEVLVKVYATSVNPLDWKIRKGKMRLLMPSRFPRILGFDVSGKVEAVGSEVRTPKIGDLVYGLLDARKNGAYAEYVVTKADYLSLKPPLSHAEAAAIPLAGLTALQALKNTAKIRPEDRVLVIGASGGVGSFAVQIAKAEGAHVTGLSSSRNESFVRALGADDVLAYDLTSIPKESRYDIIFDTIAAGSFFRLRRNLSPRGRYVATLPDIPSILVIPFLRLFGYKKRSLFVMVKPDSPGLRYLGKMVEDGKLRPMVEKTYTLEEIADAHLKSESRRTRGKLAVKVIT
jgi:NADPH:quinone reductase-like Zn-dependent oxidoreductase